MIRKFHYWNYGWKMKLFWVLCSYCFAELKVDSFILLSNSVMLNSILNLIFRTRETTLIPYNVKHKIIIRLWYCFVEFWRPSKFMYVCGLSWLWPFGKWTSWSPTQKKMIIWIREVGNSYSHTIHVYIL